MSLAPRQRCLLLALVGAAWGCAGQTAGGLLYFLMPTPSVPARFELTSGRLLILVDDDWDMLTWAPARDVLVDAIARHLTEAQACGSVVSSDTINALRHADPEFERRSISEIAQKLDAHQVLWIQVREFVASKAIEDVSRAARFTVRIKIFDPGADSPMRKRVWPESRDGEVIIIEKGANSVQECNTDDDVARMMVEDMGDMIAKLFYKHTVDD